VREAKKGRLLRLKAFSVSAKYIELIYFSLFILGMNSSKRNSKKKGFTDKTCLSSKQN